MATTSTQKQKNKLRKTKDKQGNIWYRDKYGGWINEHGVRFTKTEHRRFGYEIRKANKKIAEYMKEFPMPDTLKSKDVGSRFRTAQLSGFYRKASYRRYMGVTRRIISGYQLYTKMPKIYGQNYLRVLSLENITRMAKNNGEFSKLVELAKTKLQNLSNTQLIQLSRLESTPQINEYYNPIFDVIKADIENLIKSIDKIS